MCCTRGRMRIARCASCRKRLIAFPVAARRRAPVAPTGSTELGLDLLAEAVAETAADAVIAEAADAAVADAADAVVTVAAAETEAAAVAGSAGEVGEK